MPSATPDILEAVRHHQAGRLDEAAAIYAGILRIDSSHTDALHLSGVVEHQRGRNEQAIALIQRAVTLQPASAVFHNNLGNAQMAVGQIEAATHSFERACQLDPQYVDGWYNLGNALQASARFDEASQAYRSALALAPDHAGALTNLGAVLQTQNDFAGALECYETALKQDPDHVDAWHNMGLCFEAQSRLAEAEECFRRALAGREQFAAAYNSLGSTLREQGRMEEARDCYSRTLAIDPNYRSARSNWLMTLDYLPEVTPRTIYEERCRWGDWLAQQIAADDWHANEPLPNRRIKIGYVSPDLRNHAVATFVEPILAHHSDAVEVICYADVPVEDETSGRLKSLAAEWRNIFGKSDEQVAQLIKQDRIDILVDLAGHTARNRLRVFAGKPAPIQVTYLGDATTIGLAAIDYRLSDAWADPWHEETYCQERLIRLPGGFLCFQPPATAPAVAELPAARNGFITFGSFNTLAKMTGEVIRVWADLLKRVPNSRLLLKAGALRDRGVCERYRAMSQQQGIPGERVEFIGQVEDSAEHFALYHRIDIGLDPFPYAGTTTTCEALWMGVPVVTLTGQTHVGRVGVSLLSQLGLNELAARDENEYLRILMELAADQERLTVLRCGLRTAMSQSSLCDAAGFTHRLESALRGMWREWCQDRLEA